MDTVVVLARSFGKASSEPLDILKKAGLTVAVKKDPEPENEMVVADLIAGAQAVIVGMDRIGEMVLSRCSNLRVVSKHGVGVDNVDCDAARRHGVVVANAPGTNSDSVADMTLALMLGLARKVPAILENVRNRVWSASAFGSEMGGKVLGLVGFGRIGQGVARRARGFDMDVLFYDPLITETEIAARKVLSLSELFSGADYISLHAPLSESTRGMVNESLLGLMKKEAFLINTARGELIDEAVLFRFLKEGRIAGAGLDVFSEEPPFDSPLMTLPNVLATPHVASHTREANSKMGTIAAENVVRVLRGEEPLYRVT
ncbi:MAG TPA: phosphoglycerate dehydrogenase [Atribacteraceae bacterium]|nr:phosphoglycerate dehydrogenase [Atribacteraceae bacterium]